MNDRAQRITILGMGYVGLTLAVVMAECGYRVTGVEINPDTIRTLERGEAHFYEVGLGARLRRQLRAGSLRFTDDHLDAGVRESEVFIITVGTPLDEHGQPRMDMVQRASSQVAEAMPEDALVILRSTVKLGTTRKVADPILAGSGKSYSLAYCPERTIEGKALEELRTLPQVVGGLTEDDAWRAAQVFQSITPTTRRVSSLEAAEVIKLLDNSYRDLFFSFGNEVALLCEAAGLDGLEVIEAANSGYERTSIALPGMVGGPCLEKDPHILRASMAEFNYEPRLITTGRDINERLPQDVIGLLDDYLTEVNAEDAKIAVCGVAFKGRPETDDLRGTPARYLIEALRKRLPNAEIVGQDFAVSDAGIASLGLTPVAIEDAFRDSTLVVIANNNAKYEWLDLDDYLPLMKQPGIVFDMWDCLQSSPLVRHEGITVLRLGSVRTVLGEGNE